MKNKDIDIISITIPDNTDTIEEIYSNLFNSLGVEPGLLSKTKIGSQLNEKYHNDSIDAMIYTERYLRDNLEKLNNNESTDDNTKSIDIIDEIKTFIADVNRNKLKYVDNSEFIKDKPSLSATLDSYKHFVNITDDELLDQLRVFIKLKYDCIIMPTPDNK